MSRINSYKKKLEPSDPFELDLLQPNLFGKVVNDF